jgi:hypothetical protein
MSRESFELVVHENQLRPGLLVEVHGCVSCGHRERFMLLSFCNDGTSLCDHCGAEAAWNWEGSGCRPEGYADQWCACNSIAEGRLYIVNPFDDQAETTTKAKPRKRERTRG